MLSIILKLPYMPEIGKNKMKGFVRGRYYTKPDYKKAVEEVANTVKLKSVAERIKWEKKKIWVEIFLQKPMMRCDVANLIDGLLDAIEQGIGINDCYYSVIGNWDFDKNKEPFIQLKITQ